MKKRTAELFEVARQDFGEEREKNGKTVGPASLEGTLALESIT